MNWETRRLFDNIRIATVLLAGSYATLYTGYLAWGGPAGDITILEDLVSTTTGNLYVASMAALFLVGAWTIYLKIKSHQRQLDDENPTENEILHKLQNAKKERDND